jgi:neutral ceramidase
LSEAFFEGILMFRAAVLALLLTYNQDPAPLKAGFSEIDISPATGTRKIGWNNKNFGTSVLDPLYAKAAVFECGDGRAAFIGLDLLFVHRDQVAEIRKRIQEKYGFPGEAVMIGATHNHAGPAIETDLYPKDEGYVQLMIEKSVAVFGQAWESRREAEIGHGSVNEWSVGYNRRVIYRDGTTRCHGSFKDPNALTFEGPVDPEVAVLAARAKDGTLLGAVVNFACHPCHHGGDQVFSAGYPGQLANAMREKKCPVTLFLQGAGGNIHHGDPSGANKEKSMEEAGQALAVDVEKALAAMKFRATAKISSRTRTLDLPYRRVSDDEVKGKVKGAQRFGEPGFYDRTADLVLEEIKREGTAKAEVQAILLDDLVHVAIPAEYFVQHGLWIKEQGHPRRVRVVGYANGMLGYVPHKEAFPRGGYETTFGYRSKLAPEAGDLLADAAIQLIR